MTTRAPAVLKSILLYSKIYNTEIITIITVTITIHVVPPSYCRGREMATAQGTRFIEIYKPAPLLPTKVCLFKIATVN